MKRARARAVAAALVVTSLGLAAACRTPTDITLHVTTDVPCDELGSTTITVGHVGEIETAPPTTSTQTCGADGFVGTLVVVPAGSDDEAVGLKVVSGSNRLAESCGPPDYKGCVVQRRALHYLPHKELRVNVAMDRDCIDVPCSANETCYRARCVSSEIRDPGTCEGAGCSAEQLEASDGGGVDAGDLDAGAEDATLADTSVADTSVTDTNVVDTSVVDVGLDAAVCAPGQAGCVGLSPATCQNGAFVATGAPACAVACSLGSCVTVRGIATGVSHTCAVLTDDAVRCWGDNASRQLGVTTLASSARPVDPGFTAASIVAGGNATCNLRRDGVVECWGANESGQLGVAPSALASSAAPVVVPGVVAATNDGGIANIPFPVTVGGAHACALAGDAGLSCWGRNVEGQSGTGAFSPTAAPTHVNVSGAVAVGAGAAHTCALVGGGGQYACWGFNSWAQLGAGAASDAGAAAPLSSTTPGGQQFALFSGDAFNVINSTPQQIARCWGRNAEGECDTENDAGAAVAASLVTVGGNGGGNLLYPWLFALGARHGCVVWHANGGSTTSDGKLECWGDNTSGQLGVGSTALASTPRRQLVTLPAPVATAAAGGDHTCVVLTDGRAACWGRNDKGQIGDGTSGSDRPSPTIVQF